MTDDAIETIQCASCETHFSIEETMRRCDRCEERCCEDCLRSTGDHLVCESCRYERECQEAATEARHNHA